MACRGLTFVPPDCASWLLWREADGPLNVFEALPGLFPLLTGQEPPFEEAIDWLQLAYSTDRAGYYVAPASMVLAQSAVAEGDELFPALLAYLRRRYPEVYGSAVVTSLGPERREIQIREGEGLRGGTSVHISIKLGAYAGRFTNLSLVGMNKPSPNLTTVYLDTPIVGPTPEPLEYVPSLKRLPPPPPPPNITHTRMYPPTGQAQPRRVMQPATGHEKTFEALTTRGEPMAKFWT